MNFKPSCSSSNSSETPLKPASDVALRLGWVSYFNDAASHVLTRVLPLYLSGVLGVSPTFVGVMEGLAEGLAVLFKSVSGWMSDRMRSRKSFVLGGYALSVLARGLYFFDHFAFLLALSRVLDRVGKGLRCPARDAMVADAAMPGQAGKAFGVTSLLDALGAFTGIGLALWLGLGQQGMTQAIFQRFVWMALPLGLVALLLMIFWVPQIKTKRCQSKPNWSIPKEIRGFLAIAFIFGLANSSDAFLVLKAQHLGLNLRHTLLVFLGFNLVAALFALPIGRLSDRYGRLRFLAVGWMIYAVCYLSFAFSTSKTSFMWTLLGYGLFYAMTEGVLRAVLADLLPPDKRGSGYGALQLVLGASTLLASPIMGLVMARWGQSMAFMSAGLIAVMAVAMLCTWEVRRKRSIHG